MQSEQWKWIDFIFVLTVVFLVFLFSAWVCFVARGKPDVFDGPLGSVLGSKNLRWIFGGGLFSGAGLVLLRARLFKDSVPTRATLVVPALSAVAAVAGVLLSYISPASYTITAKFTIVDVPLVTSSGKPDPQYLWLSETSPLKGQELRPLPASSPRNYPTSEILIGSNEFSYTLGERIIKTNYARVVEPEFSLEGSYQVQSKDDKKVAEIKVQCKPTLGQTAACELISCQGISKDSCPNDHSVRSTLHGFHLEPPVYAKEEVARGKRSGWVIPTLKTIEDLPPKDRPSYTKFDFYFKPRTTFAQSDRYYFSIRANGTDIYIDGVDPENDPHPLKRNEWNDITFGLENLDFTGSSNGEENLEITLTFLQNGQTVGEEHVPLRHYIALRSAKGEQGETAGVEYKWDATFNVSVSDPWEVFMESSCDMDQLNRDQNAFNQRAELEDPAFLYGGRQAVLRLRPKWPEMNNSFSGIAVGYKLSSTSPSQIKFTFDRAEALSLLAWANRNPALRKYKPILFDRLHPPPTDAKNNSLTCGAK